MNATTKSPVVAESYRSPVQFALALQIPIAILCFLILDGGLLAKICGIAMSAHWASIVLAMFRRPFTPTTADLLWIRWGFLGLFVPLVIIFQGIPW